MMLVDDSKRLQVKNIESESDKSSQFSAVKIGQRSSQVVEERSGKGREGMERGRAKLVGTGKDDEMSTLSHIIDCNPALGAQ